MNDILREERINFFGFRCNIAVEDITIYNSEFADSAENRNDLFVSFFKELKEKGTMETTYVKRKYIVIFKDESDGVFHCQIARKREVSLNKLNGQEIKETKEEDFPYVNIFVELKSQKILIEVNSSVFDNVDTSKKIIENIMKSYFKYKDVIIEINPITEECEFWNLIEENSKVYKITFDLNVPNWGNTENVAKEFVEDTKKLGADKTQLVMINNDGNIKPDRKVVGSFIKYISEGAGSWNVKVAGDDNIKYSVKSGERKKKISIEISKENLNNILDKIELELIKDTFNSIEAVESLRR